MLPKDQRNVLHKVPTFTASNAFPQERNQKDIHILPESEVTPVGVEMLWGEAPPPRELAAEPSLKADL